MSFVFSSSFLFVLSVVQPPTFPSEIRVTGDKGTKYSLECTNEYGMKLKFKEVVPYTHHIVAPRMPSQCLLQKLGNLGMLRIQFQLQYMDDKFSYNLRPQDQEVFSLSKPSEEKTFRLLYDRKERKDVAKDNRVPAIYPDEPQVHGQPVDEHMNDGLIFDTHKK